MRDVRFRRALSLAVNRHEINQVIYFGLAIEGQNTVLPQSPLYEPDYRAAWARFDLREANRLLDLVGLTKRGSDGMRLLPDGRPVEIIVENSGEVDRAVGRARIDPRFLAADRHQALRQAVAADLVPAPGVSPARR